MPKTISCRGYSLVLDSTGAWLCWTRPDGLIGFDLEDGDVLWFDRTRNGLVPVGATEPDDAMYEIADGLVKAEWPLEASA